MGSIQRVAFLCSVDPCHSIRYIRHKNKVFLCWVFTYIFIGAEDICPWQLYKQDAFSGSVNLPVNLVCRFRWISFAMTIGLKSGCLLWSGKGPSVLMKLFTSGCPQSGRTWRHQGSPSLTAMWYDVFYDWIIYRVKEKLSHWLGFFELPRVWPE